MTDRLSSSAQNRVAALSTDGDPISPAAGSFLAGLGLPVRLTTTPPHCAQETTGAPGAQWKLGRVKQVGEGDWLIDDTEVALAKPAEIQSILILLP